MMRIHNALKGQRIAEVHRDGRTLILVCADGVVVPIEWSLDVEPAQPTLGIVGVYGHTAKRGHACSQIGDELVGRTVESVLVDDAGRLYFRCTDDHEIVVTWHDGDAPPEFQQKNVHIVLPLPPAIGGGVGTL